MAGVPVHYALGLLFGGITGFFGGMFVGLGLGAALAGAVVVLWGVLTYVYRQDQASVPLFFIRLRYRLPRVISSYRPSRRQIVFDMRGISPESQKEPSNAKDLART